MASFECKSNIMFQLLYAVTNAHKSITAEVDKIALFGYFILMDQIKTIRGFLPVFCP